MPHERCIKKLNTYLDEDLRRIVEAVVIQGDPGDGPNFIGHATMAATYGGKMGHVPIEFVINAATIGEAFEKFDQAKADAIRAARKPRLVKGI